MAPPRVFTIPASAPFLPTLIKALLDGRLVPGFPASHAPLVLADATLYLPTRRACRLARDIFLDAGSTSAAILPRIVPIGDVDADEIAFAEAALPDAGAEALTLPDALGGLQRRLLLAQFVAQWAASRQLSGDGMAPLVATNPAAALALADDLARLIDDMTTRQVPWDKLDGLVPDNVDHYWQLTLDFLKIARAAWPDILAEHGAIEPVARRDLLIAAEAARLARTNAPVIAAGSTGSMPATAMLLATIATLPHGAVVLPGLDTDLDDASWNLIGDDGDAAAGHPQFAMHALLARMSVARDAVVALTDPATHGRERLMSEALRPAAASDQWRARLAAPSFAADADSALATMAMIEAANAEDESLAIAVALREAAETPGKTAALVTPDRALARRVIAALARWHVAVDDSGGDRLADTPAGVFIRLAADAALGGLAPVTLLALLKHPLLRAGASGSHHHAMATLERAVLRGPRPRPGCGGLAHALRTFRQDQQGLHRRDPRKAITAADLDDADSLVAWLRTALAPLETLPRAPQPLAEFAKRHADIVRALANGSQDLAAAIDALDDIAASPPAAQVTIAAADYPELLHTAISDRIVRRPELANVRIRIFGPLEARLQSVDRMVIGGLVEGIWPPDGRTDPWLNRPMRQSLGLDLPERRIGLSAHDLAQALGAPEIILTHAAKVGGAPAIASRLLQRLAAVAGKARWDAARQRGERYLAWARELDRPAGFTPVPPPAPTPPRDARPSGLSVTQIEDWLRDPYTIYARHVLALAPLDDIDTPPGAKDRGTVIHEAIGEFAAAYANKLPDDPAAALIAIGKKHFATLEDFPEARAFWWPRFQRIAHWLAGFEHGRRKHPVKVYAEIPGALKIPVGERVFTLSTRADRIERLRDGRYALLDYKTGAPPSAKQVGAGLSPQLTLEAAILRGGGFPDIPDSHGGSLAEMLYVRLRGSEPAGESCPIIFKDDSTPDSHADHALARLTGLAKMFEDPKIAYRSLVHPMWSKHYGDYDHLARVKEWSLGGGDDEW